MLSLSDDNQILVFGGEGKLFDSDSNKTFTLSKIDDNHYDI